MNLSPRDLLTPAEAGPRKSQQAVHNRHIKETITEKNTKLLQLSDRIYAAAMEVRKEITVGETTLTPALENIHWDAFAHGVFSEWYVQDLLQLELSPDDVGVDGFANESLRHLKHILNTTAKASRYSTIRSSMARQPSIAPSPTVTDVAIAELCESTVRKIQTLSPSLSKLNVDQLTHSGFFNLLSAVVRGQSSDSSEMLNKRIHAVLEARRVAVLEGENQIGSGDLLLSVNANDPQQPDPHFLQLIRLLEEKVEENRKALVRLQHQTPPHSSKSTPRKALEAALLASEGTSLTSSPIAKSSGPSTLHLSQVTGACESFLKHKMADPKRVASDLTKVEAYMAEQENGDKTAKSKFAQQRKIATANIARLTVDMKVAVDAIVEQQKLLAKIAAERAEEINSLMRVEEHEKQRHSKQLSLAKACKKYKSCLEQVGAQSGETDASSPNSTDSIRTANAYISIVQDCARQCSELLTKRESYSNKDLDLPMATAAISVSTNPVPKDDGHQLFQRTIMQDYHDALTALGFNLMAELMRVGGDAAAKSNVSDWGVESNNAGSKTGSPGERHFAVSTRSPQRMSRSLGQDKSFLDATNSPTRIAAHQLKDKIKKIEEQYNDLLAEGERHGIAFMNNEVRDDASVPAEDNPMANPQPNAILLRDRFEEFWSRNQFALQAEGRRPLVVEDPDSFLGVKVYHPKHSVRIPSPMPEDSPMAGGDELDV